MERRVDQPAPREGLDRIGCLERERDDMVVWRVDVVGDDAGREQEDELQVPRRAVTMCVCRWPGGGV